MSTSDELVLAVPAPAVSWLFDENGGEGGWLSADRVPNLGAWLAEWAEWRRRGRVEKDESIRHVSTYCLIRSGDLIFTYRRAESGSEARLHGLRSLGVGGHANIGDLLDAALGIPLDRWDWIGTVETAARREVHEEVDALWALSDDLSFAGLIASDESPVSKVHLGAAYVWETLKTTDDRDPVVPKEGHLIDPLWLTADEILADADSYEPWSRLLLDRLQGAARLPTTEAPR